jgi:hypothetical protein
LTERARSLRVQSGLPKQFWAEAVNTSAYLINRGPSIGSIGAQNTRRGMERKRGKTLAS